MNTSGMVPQAAPATSPVVRSSSPLPEIAILTPGCCVSNSAIDSCSYSLRASPCAKSGKTQYCSSCADRARRHQEKVAQVASRAVRHVVAIIVVSFLQNTPRPACGRRLLGDRRRLTKKSATQRGIRVRAAIKAPMRQSRSSPKRRSAVRLGGRFLDTENRGVLAESVLVRTSKQDSSAGSPPLRRCGKRQAATKSAAQSEQARSTRHERSSQRSPRYPPAAAPHASAKRHYPLPRAPRRRSAASARSRPAEAGQERTGRAAQGFRAHVAFDLARNWPLAVRHQKRQMADRQQHRCDRAQACPSSISPMPIFRPVCT